MLLVRAQVKPKMGKPHPYMRRMVANFVWSTSPMLVDLSKMRSNLIEDYLGNHKPTPTSTLGQSISKIKMILLDKIAQARTWPPWVNTK